MSRTTSPASPAETAEQLTMVEKDHTQHLGDRERPEAMAYAFDDLLGAEGPEQRSPFGSARRENPRDRHHIESTCGNPWAARRYTPGNAVS
jgi:hypothetical protein